MKDIFNDAFDVDQHLMANIYDVLAQILYQSSLSAAADLGKQYTKYAKKAPKPMVRPKARKDQEVKEKKFATTKDLMKMFSKKAGGSAKTRS